MPGCNCSSSETDAERGADLKFESDLKKKPQIERNTRPLADSEPGDALKGHRDNSWRCFLDGGLGRKNNRGATNAVHLTLSIVQPRGQRGEFC